MALDTELTALGVKKIVFKGEAEGRIIACKCSSGSDDMFLGAAVTRHGETVNTPEIDLCAEDEALMGFIIGLVHPDAYDPMYHTPTYPFTDGDLVWVFMPKSGAVIWVCSETASAITQGEHIEPIAGEMGLADTGAGGFDYYAEDAVAGAGSTEYYYRVRKT